jgi:hypothetical protein
MTNSHINYLIKWKSLTPQPSLIPKDPNADLMELLLSEMLCPGLRNQREWRRVAVFWFSTNVSKCSHLWRHKRGNFPASEEVVSGVYTTIPDVGVLPCACQDRTEKEQLKITYNTDLRNLKASLIFLWTEVLSKPFLFSSPGCNHTTQTSNPFNKQLTCVHNTTRVPFIALIQR